MYVVTEYYADGSRAEFGPYALGRTLTVDDLCVRLDTYAIAYRIRRVS